MRSLYLRIYLTVVAALALFALVSGWLVQRHLEDQRVRAEGAVRERVEAWGELLQRSLPPRKPASTIRSPPCATGHNACACPWRWTTQPASDWGLRTPSCAEWPNCRPSGRACSRFVLTMAVRCGCRA
jgi:hypothetical protein